MLPSRSSKKESTLPFDPSVSFSMWGGVGLDNRSRDGTRRTVSPPSQRLPSRSNISHEGDLPAQPNVRLPFGRGSVGESRRVSPPLVHVHTFPSGDIANGMWSM